LKRQPVVLTGEPIVVRGITGCAAAGIAGAPPAEGIAAPLASLIERLAAPPQSLTEMWERKG
jgi:hypothetical protein